VVFGWKNSDRKFGARDRNASAIYDRVSEVMRFNSLDTAWSA